MHRIGLAIMEMLKRAADLRDQAARKQSLHPTDFGCISYLYAQDEPISPKQIIARFGLTSGSGTALLDRLEQAGFVRRLPNPTDRRSVLIELNRDAAAEPIAQYHKMQTAFRQLTDGFSDEELDVVARFLERFAELPVPEGKLKGGGAG
jgi:DNA-binding MarR family transcriptional regulator